MRRARPSWPSVAFSGHPLSMKIDRAGFPVHRRRAGAGRAWRPRRRRRCWPRPFAAARRRSSPSSSAIPTAASPQDAGRRRLAGRRPVMIAGAARPALGAARASGSRSASSCRRWTCTSTACRSAAASRASSTGRASSCRPTTKRSNDNERNEIWIDHDGQTVVVPAGRRHPGAPHRLPRRRRATMRRARRALRRDEVRLAHGRVPADRRASCRSRSGERVVGGETVLARCLRRALVLR